MTARGRLAVFALTAFLASAVCVPAGANQVIPTGGATLLASGQINLACTDLIVNGLLDTGTGSYVNVLNITVGATGVVQGTGTINYSGALTNSGVIQPGVNLALNSACAVPAQVEQKIPTLSNWMLVVLAGLLLCLAGAVMSGRGAVRRRSEAKGAIK